MILEDLENALAEHAPPGGGELSSELPPLTIDGIPVSVDKMTQVGTRWRCKAETCAVTNLNYMLCLWSSFKSKSHQDGTSHVF